MPASTQHDRRHRHTHWLSWRVWLLGVLGMAAVMRTQVPLALVQLTGWVTMYQRYVSVYEPEDALKLTLLGQKPCHLCRLVQDVQKSSDEIPALWQATQQMPLLCCAAKHFILPRPSVERAGWPDWQARCVAWQEAPEGPPPRG